MNRPYRPMVDLTLVLSVFLLWTATDGEAASGILERTGTQGGVVVVVGCDKPEVLCELGENAACLVQGLDTDAHRVKMAREYIRKKGGYGRISASLFDGRDLPYAADLVNLVVISESSGVPESEVMRVLVPNGAMFKNGFVQRKPTSETIDEWSHFLYGPGNNAVSRDTAVGPVGGLKWMCGPLWSRSHEFTSSLSILVSAGGRVFYVVDEGIISITTPNIPERWALIARDAFNGKLLWRMPLPEWRSRLGRSKALRSVPSTAQRCIVADQDRLFFTALLGDAVKVLDAATGKVLATHAVTEGTREFVKVGESLILYQEKAGTRGQGRIARVDADTGELLWAATNDRYRGESLAATQKHVIYHNGQELICLDYASGQRRWPEAQTSSSTEQRKPARLNRVTFILHEDLVLEAGSNRIVARQAETGEVLWEAPTGWGVMWGHDCFVARGYVWHAAGNGYDGKGKGIVGYDLKTGKPTKTIDTGRVQSRGHHLRCYRSKATGDYLITPYRGVEFVSLTGREHSQTDWIRGACAFGVVPANGLLYVPPNPCFCFPGVKIRGLNALRCVDGETLPTPATPRLTKGPGYGRNDIAGVSALDWPTYRHDAMRHGTTATAVSNDLGARWKVELPGPLTPPVAASGRVFVAARDEHTIYALDADTGDVNWIFTAGARIDSPPTLYKGKVLFGCTDGYLYCVTFEKGELDWRFRAAPAERRIMIEDQLESVWPVSGSVLVVNDVVYCAAGRSSMLDGGIWLYGLRPATGELLYETRVNTLKKVRDDYEGTPIVPAYAMEGTHADILVSEGDSIFMGTMQFDFRLKAKPTPIIMDVEKKTVGLDISKAEYTSPNAQMKKDGYEKYLALAGNWWIERTWPKFVAELEKTYGGRSMGDRATGRHIAPTAGFLDDSWFNRTYWMYSDKWPGFYHGHRGAKTGQFLVVGPERTYALQAFHERNRESPLFTPQTRGYLLIADRNDSEPVLDFKTRGSTKGLGYTRTQPPVWHRWIKVRVRGMVKAGPTLFVAGAPDVVDPQDPYASFEGRKGAKVLAINAEDGRTLKQLDVDTPPVFDGLIAAYGKLFMCTTKDEVVCFTGK